MKSKTFEYFFINKCVFFPKKGILTVGDLHLGYEISLIKSGILTPKMQNKELIKELRKTFMQIRDKGMDIRKIIFLGDIKHSFGFEFEEKFSFKEVYEFLKKHFKERDIIFIKGNHDTIDYSFKKKMKNYYSVKDKHGKIIFIHGHKDFLEIHNKEIKMIVMGHIHPCIELQDKHTRRKERFKCFLTGTYQGKEFIILPSFLDNPVGQPVNEYYEGYKDYFSIIPKKALLKFNVHVIGKKKIYDFGILKKLNF